MRAVLDANICIYLIKKRPRRVLGKFDTYSDGEIGISSIPAAGQGMAPKKASTGQRTTRR